MLNDLFTSLYSKINFFNAWIFVIPTWLIGIIIARTNSAGIKKATDMTWYSGKEKVTSFLSLFLQMSFFIISIFIQLELNSVMFYIGLILAIIGFAGHIAAKISFGKSEINSIAEKGVYSISRNPMYFSMIIIFTGAVIASKSLLLLILLIGLIVTCHFLILGEERYCKEKYGDIYNDYIQRVPRYLIF